MHKTIWNWWWEITQWKRKYVISDVIISTLCTLNNSFLQHVINQYDTEVHSLDSKTTFTVQTIEINPKIIQLFGMGQILGPHRFRLLGESTKQRPTHFVIYLQYCFNKMTNSYCEASKCIMCQLGHSFKQFTVMFPLCTAPERSSTTHLQP